MGRRNNYSALNKTWSNNTEDFVPLRASVRGPMVCPAGAGRLGMQPLGPQCGPVEQPSLLSVPWRKAFSEAGDSPDEGMGVL